MDLFQMDLQWQGTVVNDMWKVAAWGGQDIGLFIFTTNFSWFGNLNSKPSENKHTYLPFGKTLFLYFLAKRSCIIKII